MQRVFRMLGCGCAGRRAASTPNAHLAPIEQVECAIGLLEAGLSLAIRHAGVIPQQPPLCVRNVTWASSVIYFGRVAADLS